MDLSHDEQRTTGLVSDAPHFSSSWAGIAMLSRRTWCARAPLALLAALPLVTPMPLFAGLPLVTLMALLAGPPLVTLLPLRTLLSRGPLLRSCACVATANKYG